MGVVWVHWLMARGQILKESLWPLWTPYRRQAAQAGSAVSYDVLSGINAHPQRYVPSGSPGLP